jgi:hypothetical protein
VDAAGDEVRLDEEIADALGREELLEPRALLDVPVRGRRPRAAGAVGALGQPDSRRPRPEVALRRAEADVELPLDRPVVRQERKEAVCRRPPERLEDAEVGERPERGDDPAGPPAEVLEQARKGRA